MRVVKDGRIYDTEKSDCLTFSNDRQANGEILFRGLYQKKNNKEYFYVLKNKTKNDSFILPLKNSDVEKYKKYIELYN